MQTDDCIVLNEQNIVFARSSSLYATGVSLGPPESSMQTASRSLPPFLAGLLGDRPTNRPTDHATRSVTIGAQCTVEKPNSAVIVYGYNKYFWSSRLDRSDQLQQSAAYSAVKLDGLQCIWRYTAI